MRLRYKGKPFRPRLRMYRFLPMLLLVQFAIKSLRRLRRSLLSLSLGSRCAYCGGKRKIVSMTIDHIRAQCYGGNDNLSNILPACYGCNQKKNNTRLDLFRKTYFDDLPFYFEDGIPWEFPRESIKVNFLDYGYGGQNTVEEMILKDWGKPLTGTGSLRDRMIQAGLIHPNKK